MMNFRVQLGPELGPYPIVTNAATGEKVFYSSLKIVASVGKPTMITIKTFAVIDGHAGADPSVKDGVTQ